MRFALSDEHAAFRDAAGELLAKACPPAAVRAAGEVPAGELDREVWAGLDAMGVLALLAPEEAGGLGLDETYLVPVLEECGRVALPHPVVETAMVAVPLLGPGCGMASTDLGGPVIPCAADADVLVLRDGAGDGLVRVDRAALALDPVATVDRARRGGRLPEGPAEALPGAERVGADPATVARAEARGVLGTAAYLLGLGQAMLDQTVAYVAQRHQFGRPVGSFQAVKHHLADVALGLEFARPAVWRAAWTLANDAPTWARDVSMAKVMASGAAERAGRHALQCHGAIGYTVEADLHLLLKRTWALARSWGDADHHVARVAADHGL